ncbi:ABC transporter ATP-binding protein [Sodalis sp. CWE]|uniref:ABC transporter ATP-binding protein n=1 Tax=Sodalis sp. CWE TaxID=2803816 RepID=UPI001C7D8353|nr:ABC transporter ATP-binding protein [Sodalis sp. CWE]MBX4181190.1 ABC transporter ATP-binding protein [Sodalis sp. CWE]
MSSSLGVIVQNLALRWKNQVIFDNLSFSLSTGRCTVVLGASGVGKTSLLKIIAGLIKPDSGIISGTDGLPLLGRCSYMSQNDLLYPWLTVKQNITIGARLRREKCEDDWAGYLLNKVGLDKFGKSFPSTLSGGMRQRAALARTIYERRPVVLMDEPFSSLDALTRLKIQILSAKLLSKRTVFLITHDPQEAYILGHCLRFLVGNPARFNSDLFLDGEPPRISDDLLMYDKKRIIMHWLIEKLNDGEE